MIVDNFEVEEDDDKIKSVCEERGLVFVDKKSNGEFFAKGVTIRGTSVDNGGNFPWRGIML